MTKRRKRLFIAVVLWAGGLLVLAGVFWWRSARAPVFRFLAGQRPVYHVKYIDGTIDLYSWPADFKSVAAQADKELLRAGFVDNFGPNSDSIYRSYSRQGPRRMAVYMRPGKFEKVGQRGPECNNTPGWVVVDVRRGPFAPFKYLRYLRGRVMSPPPLPKAKSTTAE